MSVLKKSVMISAMVSLLGMQMAADAPAAVQYLSIDWDLAHRQVLTMRFDGIDRLVAVAPGVGWVDGTFDHLNTPGGRSVPGFCLDIFNTANDWTPADNFEYDVREYTEADGLAGWTTPITDTDSYRNLGSLTRAFYLVNTYGRGLADPWRRNALNVAIWKAAYGPRLDYVSGLLPGDQTDAFNAYIAAYETGAVATEYRWFDNKYDDTEDLYQDWGSTPPIPEPATILLLASGLLGSGLAMRRRRS